MKKFRVQCDFRKYQPVWNASNKEIFGDNNEGFIIEGDNENEAFETWNEKQLPGKRLNKFYVKITEIL